MTDRGAAGQERLEQLLTELGGTEGLTVQLRETGVTDREMLSRARRARQALGPDVPLYVNRRFDVALAAGADGVHLPAAGLPLRRVRANTPRRFRVGASTHSATEAIAAIEEGADLVVLGPIFDTPSKRSFGPPLSPAELGKLPPASSHACEVYVIGGIDQTRLGEIHAYRDRIAGVAAVRLFQDAADPRAVLASIAGL